MSGGSVGVAVPFALAAAVLGAGSVAGVVSARRTAVDDRARARVAGLASPGAGHRLALPPAPGWILGRAEDAGLEEHAVTAWWVWVGAALVAPPVAWVLAGPGLAALALVLVAGAPAGAGMLLAGRGERQVDEALPDALEALARHLRSGAGVRQALAGVAGADGPVGRDLQRVVQAVEQGRSLRAALEDWARWRPRPGVRLAVAALVLGAETGGAEARAVDGVAATLRARAAVRREVHALAAQARASAAVLVVAPVVFAALAAATDPRTASFLFATPLGVACLAGGVLLDLVGGVWMARLCRIDR